MFIAIVPRSEGTSSIGAKQWRRFGKILGSGGKGYACGGRCRFCIAPIVINYLKLVVKTSTIVADPPDYVERGKSLHPSIIALWHGQFLLLPAIYPREIPGRAIVAKHDDAEALRRILKHFGLGLVRGAGAAAPQARPRRRRGGTWVDSLAHEKGFSIALTGDIPPGPARKCGVGIVLISSRSGRPIVPFAVATSRYRSVNSWSRMTINLPFSRLGIAMGEPIHVPTDAGPAVLETYRQRVEAALNEVTAKAYALPART